MSDHVRMRWLTWAIIVAWLGLISLVTIDRWIDARQAEIRAALPVELWFRVGSITVEDATAGECPAMTVDRDIGLPFYAEWAVTIMQGRQSGGWTTHRTFRGANDYRPGHALPADLDLCWWAGINAGEIDELGLVPGKTYKVNTFWDIDTGDSGRRQIRRTTPSFAVRPAGSGS